MAKKSVIAGEYILSVLDSGSIEVYRIYDNVKGALREIAEKEDFWPNFCSILTTFICASYC